MHFVEAVQPAYWPRGHCIPSGVAMTEPQPYLTLIAPVRFIRGSEVPAFKSLSWTVEIWTRSNLLQLANSIVTVDPSVNFHCIPGTENLLKK